MSHFKSKSRVRSPLRPTNEPLDLLDVERVLEKYFFSEEEKIPPEIPMRNKRGNGPRASGKPKEHDDGVLHYEKQNAGARFLEQDFTKAEEGQWRPVSISWWEQTKRYSNKKQLVVEVVWQNQPDDELKFTPEMKAALKKLATRFSWMVRIFSNQSGRPATINFTSPKPRRQECQVVIQDDYITME